jgi:chemotaxis protein MotA
VAEPAEAAVARKGGLDKGIVLGIVIAVVALGGGIAISGISARYFWQPTGVMIVIGGTLGVTLITTPRASLLLAFRRTIELFSRAASSSGEELVAEILSYGRVVRTKGILAIEPSIDRISEPFLKQSLLLALDVSSRPELQSALENKIRMCERQSETAAKVLEIVGGFTPTIGVLGTVVGLIDVLRQFSSLPIIAYGVGAAFTSTIYGLALANLVLLPAAHRIRARAAELFELQELMAEGALCLFDGMHPRLIQQRLESYLNAAPGAALRSSLPVRTAVDMEQA